ncbi:uncharacterized protein LOC109719454 [Ananas comosus]|uniref:Uncharacterized protein LOC109719454 n=1 Tax=Ananas comosus TaxID=4615 RepID=A0A6P5FZD9_ANACO|nr:uncharacterized protein LOC109719454 [Ananas comosus]
MRVLAMVGAGERRRRRWRIGRSGCSANPILALSGLRRTRLARLRGTPRLAPTPLRRLFPRLESLNASSFPLPSLLPRPTALPRTLALLDLRASTIDGSVPSSLACSGGRDDDSWVAAATTRGWRRAGTRRGCSSPGTAPGGTSPTTSP